MRRMTGYFGLEINFITFFPTAISFQDSALIKSHLRDTLHTVKALKELNRKGSGVQRTGQLGAPIPGNLLSPSWAALEASSEGTAQLSCRRRVRPQQSMFHAGYPWSKLLWQLFALSAKISFKSQIFQLCVGSNDIAGNMNLHHLLYHQAFNFYILKTNKKKKPKKPKQEISGDINTTSLIKIKLGRF